MALISNGDQILTKNVYNSDETVLWEGTAYNGTISEVKENFERIKVYCVDDASNTCCLEMLSSYNKCSGLIGLTSSNNCQFRSAHIIFNGTSFSIYFQQVGFSGNSVAWTGTLTSSDTVKAIKVVGIGRKGGV